MALGGIVPEEKLALGLLVVVGTSGVDGLHGVRIYARVEYLGAQGHGSGREILNLLQLEIEPLGYDGKFGHILLGAARMTAYKVGDKLLTQTALLVYLVKSFLKLLKLKERGLAHKCQD